MRHQFYKTFSSRAKILTIVFLVSISFQSITKTYFVSKNPDSNPVLKMPSYNQILLAVKVAGDGDTIMIDAGWYDNDFTQIDKKLVIIGNQSSAGYRKTEREFNKESIISFSGNPTAYLYINAAGVIIDGIKFGIDNQLSLGGIYINAANVEIRNCLFAKNSGSNIYISSNGTNTRITENYFISSENECILNNAENVFITGNYISNSNDAPVVYSTQKITVKSNTLISANIEKIVVSCASPNLSFIAGNENITTFKNDYTIDNESVESTKEGLIPKFQSVPNKLQSFFDNNCNYGFNTLINPSFIITGLCKNQFPDCGYLKIKTLSYCNAANSTYESSPESFTLLTFSPNKKRINP